MSNVRWLGPYTGNDRHADSKTIDYIIDLRKRLQEAERQRDNAVAQCEKQYKEIWRLRSIIVELGGFYEDEERKC